LGRLHFLPLVDLGLLALPHVLIQLLQVLAHLSDGFGTDLFGFFGCVLLGEVLDEFLSEVDLLALLVEALGQVRWDHIVKGDNLPVGREPTQCRLPCELILQSPQGEGLIVNKVGEGLHVLIELLLFCHLPLVALGSLLGGFLDYLGNFLLNDLGIKLVPRVVFLERDLSLQVLGLPGVKGLVLLELVLLLQLLLPLVNDVLHDLLSSQFGARLLGHVLIVGLVVVEVPIDLSLPVLLEGCEELTLQLIQLRGDLLPPRNRRSHAFELIPHVSALTALIEL